MVVFLWFKDLGSDGCSSNSSCKSVSTLTAREIYAKFFELGGILENRLNNATEGLIFGLIFAGLFWLLGLIIKAITGKEIRTSGGYAVAVVLGFLSRHALITVLTA